MAELYSNNAVGVLADGIDDSTDAIELASSVGAERFASPTSGDFQRATITNDADEDEFEIVHIVDRTSLSFTVLRGQEDTASRAWAAGSKLSARVTAKMLDGYLGMDSDGIVKTLPGRPSGAFVVNGRTNGGGDVQISGYPVLTKITAKPTTTGGAAMLQDTNLSHEVVGGSLILDLGDSVPTWAADTFYPAYSLVKPPTPDGFMYLFEAVDGNQSSQTPTTPLFSGNSDTCAALNGADVVGQWIPIPDPVEFEVLLSGNDLVVTEVGFICMTDDATTTPVVSIGTDADPTRFASAVSLSQIGGTGHVHRIPITTGGATADRLAFSLDTAATGRMIGRFYWRGFFVQLD